jgi:hypothetical protein
MKAKAWFHRWLLALLLIIATQVQAFDIYALGTSNTNCKNAGQTYTAKLEQFLREKNLDARVINGGVDGDKPIWMMNRLKSALTNHADVKLVIFEPGPNERSKKWNLEPSAEILDFLHNSVIPTIYVSHSWLQSEEEAAEFAKTHGAYFYGHWNKGVPTDTEHRQYDMPGSAGHMTVLGCEKWAMQMASTVEQIVREKNIR